MATVSVLFNAREIGEFALDRPAIVVGRDANCDIQIDNLGISRTHCQFIRRGAQYLVQDMNSSNGTYVNGQKVGEQFLSDGDEILVGKHTLVYHAFGTAEPSGPPVPDGHGGPEVVHTYVMDGQMIRDRLARMKAEGGPPEERKGTERITAYQAPVAAAPPPPRPAAAIAAGFDVPMPRGPTAKLSRPVARALAPAPGGGRALLCVSLALNLVLAGAIVVLIVLVLKLMDRLDAPSARPERPAATPGRQGGTTEDTERAEEGEVAM